MPVLQLSEVCLAYGHVALLDHVDLVVEEGERIGLIGRNGTGKSSLLKIVTGQAAADDGRVWVSPDTRVVSVAQEPALEPGDTVYDAAAAPLLALLHEGEDWSAKHRVEGLLERLHLDPQQKVASLSGGQKKRTALAAALATEPQLLLLDEPTNHLDVAAIEWLEETLAAFNGALIVVTHDRRFLDRIATRIVELDRGRLLSYPGNFGAYETRKAEQLAIEAVENRKFDKVLAQEEAWIRKGVEARRTRNEGRVRRLDALRAERAARRDRLGGVELTLSAGERSGKLVAELEHVTKRYGDRAIVHDYSDRIMRGDKIGLIGPNGSGKTTLLKLILGELEPDEGTVRMGSKVAVAYFDQFRAALDEEATLADSISQGSDFVEVDGQRRHVISYLESFLFPPERARAPVKSLSGGERNRLLLARLFSRPANVLALDEPTNDLDIETLELLESLLQEYHGTVFLVSHDRAFLDNVVTQTIAFEGDGHWKEYAGGYLDWERARKAAAREERDEQRKADARGAAPAKAQRVKLSFKETRELEQLPAQMEALESEQKALVARLADPALYQDRTVDLKALNTRAEEIDAELTRLLTRWELLEAKSTRGSTSS
ncbi:ATP-binding cassette domain-containing protein [Usitatibacter palustris]|uniref:ATP-binding protein Uup n=1 Tax=Usitatibacter palustris TaxID=2732487 RepID=A0A6M4H5J1_9PROT|nr:ATP-binding cassette domain-containing protein [Usitatibacter palustris]QJR14921.1 ABC transporter ATP-binding protein uup [Usitatibacter palustris]